MSATVGSAALQEFVAECSEMLERIGLNLAAVEGRPINVAELLHSICRDAHTVKGSAQLFGFQQIGMLAHGIEGCLEIVKLRPAAAKPDLVDLLLRSTDVMQKILAGIRQNEKEPDCAPDLEDLVPRLSTYAENDNAPTNEPTAPSPEAIVETAPAPEDVVEPSVEAEKPVRAKTEEHANETIRVNVGLLDNLMNLVGELVLVRNQLLQVSNRQENSETHTMSQRLNIITSELQNEVMKTRMQPIGNILSKFTRVVRDMSRELNKRVELDMEGVDTELDKTIIEAVRDPLTHIIRNAVDHGIETPSERKASGKPEVATIRVRAYHESGQIIVEISDDGRGLDRNKIMNKAIEKGLVTADVASKMTEREIYNFIFAPGFSTAAVVSNISGRGVGLDVVKTNIEKIGGVVDLQSTVGKGASIRMKIPLTLAIVPALIIRCGTERFAIPQVKLVELLRLSSGEETSTIELLHGRPVCRLRGDLLPLVNLKDVLTGQVSHFDITQKNDDVNVVVLNADKHTFGLIVDRIEDSADIVVKPLSQFLKDINVFSGATIMGDGQIALTLDVIGLAETIHVADENAQQKHLAASAKAEKEKSLSSLEEYLLVNIGVPGRYVIPLSMVNRLEEFERTQLELAGELNVVRYRDNLLPIFSLQDNLNLPNVKTIESTTDKLPVVVVKRNNKLIGVEVSEIVDVVTTSATVDKTVRDRQGISGTIVHDNKVLVVLDMPNIVDHMRSSMGGGVERKVESKELTRNKHRILVVDDSAFFRGHIRQIIVDAGYPVENAIDGMDAMEKIATTTQKFSAVLSDIEMPKMDGLELARKIRSEADTKTLPLIAISTKCDKKDVERGLDAGFNKYLAKLNPDQLLRELDELIGISA